MICRLNFDLVFLTFFSMFLVFWFITLTPSPPAFLSVFPSHHGFALALEQCNHNSTSNVDTQKVSVRCGAKSDRRHNEKYRHTHSGGLHLAFFFVEERQPAWPLCGRCPALSHIPPVVQRHIAPCLLARISFDHVGPSLWTTSRGTGEWRQL